MALVTLLIGLLIAVQGLLGLAAPDLFVRVIRFFQNSPVIYLAAIIRVAVGVALVRAAPASRARRGLQILGIIIVVGGLLTPFVGERAAHVILDSWSAGGPGIVRLWASIALAIGVFILYAVGLKPVNGRVDS